MSVQMIGSVDFLDSVVPARLQSDPVLARKVLGYFRLKIDGAGVWALEMVGQARIVRDGELPESHTVTIMASDTDFSALLSDPALAWDHFVGGALRVSDACRSLALLEAFFPGAVRKGVPAPLLRLLPSTLRRSVAASTEVQ